MTERIHNAPSRRTIVAGAAWTVPAVALAVATPAAASSQPPSDFIGGRSLQFNHFHIHEVAAHIQPGELFDTKVVIENDSETPDDPAVYVPAGTTITIQGVPPLDSFVVQSISNPDWSVSFVDGPTAQSRQIILVLNAPLPNHNDESEIVVTFMRKVSDLTPEEKFEATGTLSHPQITLPGSHTTDLVKDDKFKYEF